MHGSQLTARLMQPHAASRLAHNNRILSVRGVSTNALRFQFTHLGE